METNAGVCDGEDVSYHGKPSHPPAHTACLLCGLSESAVDGKAAFVEIDSLRLYLSGTEPLAFLSSLLEIEERRFESGYGRLCACCCRQVKYCSRLVHMVQTLQQRLHRLSRRLVYKFNKATTRQSLSNGIDEQRCRVTVNGDMESNDGNVAEIPVDRALQQRFEVPASPLQPVNETACLDRVDAVSPVDGVCSGVEEPNGGSAAGEHLDWNELLAPRTADSCLASNEDSTSSLLRSLLTRTTSIGTYSDGRIDVSSAALVTASSEDRRLTMSVSTAQDPSSSILRTPTVSSLGVSSEPTSRLVSSDRRSPITVFQLPDGKLLMRCPSQSNNTDNNQPKSKYTRLSQADISNLMAAGKRLNRKKHPYSRKFGMASTIAKPAIERDGGSESASLSSNGSHDNGSTNILQSILQANTIGERNEMQSPSRPAWVCAPRGRGNLAVRSDTESCPLCALHFSTRSEVDAHLRDHALRCNWCGVQCESRLSLFQHRPHCIQRVEIAATGRRVDRDPSTKSDHFSCGLCPATFCRINRLNEHVLAVHRRPFRCPQCWHEYTALPSYEEHLQVIHGVSTPYPCNLCGFTFVRATLVARHFQLHHSAVYCRDSVGIQLSTTTPNSPADTYCPPSRSDPPVVYSTASLEPSLSVSSQRPSNLSQIKHSPPLADDLCQHMVIVKQEFLSSLND